MLIRNFNYITRISDDGDGAFVVVVAVVVVHGSSYVDLSCLIERIANDIVCIGKVSRHYEYANASLMCLNRKMPYGIDDTCKKEDLNF